MFRTIVELLAAIPSVVVRPLGPLRRRPCHAPGRRLALRAPQLHPFFGTTLSGPGMAPARLVLAIMVLPTVAAVSQDALRLVPYKVKEAAYGMGTTRWEAILKVLLPGAPPPAYSGRSCWASAARSARPWPWPC